MSDQAQLEPQTVPGEAGIWVFVGGDLLVFAFFFIGLLAERASDTVAFDRDMIALRLGTGLADTLLLLVSSWFVVNGVRASNRGASPLAQRWLLAAIGCGIAFVVNKGAEWGALVASDITPVTSTAYTWFFGLTAIHLLHVLVGIGVLLRIRALTVRALGDDTAQRGIESGAIFWHLVDLLWIMLFTLFYVAG